MAIPSTPTNLYVQQGNRQVYLSWDLSTGSTSYSVQRSTDNVTFVTISSTVVTNYLDTAVSVGVQYFYQVASTNGSGTSSYTTSQSIIPTPTAEMSLGQIRLAAQQRADRVNSNFVTLPEWNSYINQAMYELYDLLITVYEDYFVATPYQFTSDGTTFQYAIPDGALSFENGITGASGYIAPPLYKLMGIDLAINNANNAYVTVNKFTFMDRNRFVYPNTASTIYGVFNLQYRMLGNVIQFIPTPSSGQKIRVWYVPRLNQLLKDTDLTSDSISGWIEYVIVRAAKYALDKEESDSSKLDAELAFLKQRIEESASNRDQGQPDRITDVRQNGSWGSMSGGYGANGPLGGF